MTLEESRMLQALIPFAEVSKRVKGKDEACWCGQDGAVIRYKDLREAEAIVMAYTDKGELDEEQ